MNPVVGACMAVVALFFYLLLAIRPVTVDVNPHVAFAPAYVRVTVRVEPNAENRNLTVIADSTEGYRRSDVSLEGEGAAVVHQFEWPRMDAGEYDVSATVTSNVATLAKARTHLQVLGR
jgi:hypothetical protein